MDHMSFQPYDSEVPSDSQIRAHHQEGNQIEEMKRDGPKNVEIPKPEYNLN